MNVDTTTIVMEGQCCECGAKHNAASGDGLPSPGDFSLCCRCGSLNVFNETLSLRAPTEDEILAAAADGDVQRMRRVILGALKQINNAPSATDPRLTRFDIDLLRDLSGDKVEGICWGAAMGEAIGPLVRWGYLSRTVVDGATSYQITD